MSQMEVKEIHTRLSALKDRLDDPASKKEIDRIIGLVVDVQLLINGLYNRIREDDEIRKAQDNL